MYDTVFEISRILNLVYTRLRFCITQFGSILQILAKIVLQSSIIIIIFFLYRILFNTRIRRILRLHVSIAHSLYGYFPGNTRVMVSLFFLLSFFLLNYGRIFEASYFLLNILLLINRSYSNIRIVPRYIGLDLPVLERSSGAAVLVQPCTRARFVRRTV